MENLTRWFERRISAFIRDAAMSPSEFGQRAVGDRSFWGDLRRGRSPRLATVDRALAFMADWERANGRDRSSGDPSVEPGRSRSGGNGNRETREKKT